MSATSLEMFTQLQQLKTQLHNANKRIFVLEGMLEEMREDLNTDMIRSYGRTIWGTREEEEQHYESMEAEWEEHYDNVMINK